MINNCNFLLAPVAAGELIDKITILRIKATRLKQPEALVNVHRELQLLLEVVEGNLDLESFPLKKLTIKLHELNILLWDVEDSLRLLETEQKFDDEFIAIARSVYQLNDKRAATKRQINQACGSSLIEEKSYGNTNQ